MASSFSFAFSSLNFVVFPDSRHERKGAPAQRQNCLPLPACQELDERSKWASVLQRHVPPVLPVQPARRALGHRQALLGPLRLRRPRELGLPRHRARPNFAVRRRGLLVGLGHGPIRRPRGHPLHRTRRRRRAGAERGLPQEPVGPAAPRVAQARRRSEPRHPAARGRDGQQLPGPHDGVAGPRRPLEVRRHGGGRRRGLHARVPQRGLRPLGAEPRAAARVAGRARLGVPRLLPRGGARRAAGARRVGGGPGVTHVLKLSRFADEDYYAVGRYDGAAETFVPADERDGDARNWRRVDHGHLFGAKTFFDARKSRRVLWAWVDETDGSSDDGAKGWTGIQSFPRSLWLDTDGRRLVQWPVEEIETLRRRRVALLGAEVAPGGLQEIAGIDALQADVEVVFEIPSLEEAEMLDPKGLRDPQRLCAAEIGNGGVGPFGLVVMASGDMQEQTTIFFTVFRHDGTYKVLMCTDLTRSSTREEVHKPVYAGFVDVDVEKDRSISLRTLIDHSVIESFGGGGRTCITARVYPEHVATGGRSHMYVFNNGSEPVAVSRLEAWELATASVNAEDYGGCSGSI